MYKSKRILGLIPARGGSKGLPQKNVKPLMDKPLIAWTIEQAKASEYLDNVLVSTDCEQIAGVAKEWGAAVPFMRPDNLASDSSPTIDVIVHAIDYERGQKREYDYVVLLEPTSPLRADGDIDRAIRTLIDKSDNADSLVSVGEVHLEHPTIIKKIVDGYVEPFQKESGSVKRRQDLSKAYFPYGVIYMSKTDTLIDTKTFYQGNTIPYMVERWQNYEIDDINDFICIEAIMRHINKEAGK